MSIKIEKVCPAQLQALKDALKAFPKDVVGSMDPVSYGYFQPLGKTVKVHLYLEQSEGSNVRRTLWHTSFNKKDECEATADAMGYRSFAELVADPRNKFVEKIIIS